MQSRCACISAQQGRQFTCHFTTAFPARHHDPPRIYAVGDSRTPESIIPRASDPYEANQASISDDQDGWLRLTLLRRELQTAIAEEDYELAARLRDQAQVLSQNLPSCKQLLLGLLEKLRSGRARERLTAVQQLGDLGDAAALASLQPVLAGRNRLNVSFLSKILLTEVLECHTLA
jgi:type III secretion system FlhB-like substrate exporter